MDTNPSPVIALEQVSQEVAARLTSMIVPHQQPAYMEEFVWMELISTSAIAMEPISQEVIAKIQFLPAFYRILVKTRVSAS